VRRLERLAGALIFLVVWQLGTAFHLVNELFLPSPVTVLRALTAAFLDGSMLPDLGNTFYRLLSGYGLGVTLGIPLGLAAGSSRRLYNSLEFLIDFFRSIPVTSLFPLFLFFFGIGDLAKIAIVTYSVAIINLFNTMYGVRNSSPTRLLVARVFGASKLQQFIGVIIPEALPQIVVGLRLSLSSALVYVIVTEMFLGSTDGLGYRIYDANLTYRVADMYASILLAGLIGYGVNQGLIWFENRFIHWRAT
jgi:NitT/TauT family transport system permease protein